MKLLLSNRGSAQHGQDPNKPLFGCADDVWVTTKTIEESSIIVKEYIRVLNLGSSNWAGGTIKDAGKVIGQISYNGTFIPNPISYRYAIVIKNYENLAKEKTILNSKFKRKDYALICKLVYKNKPEKIEYIEYSNNIPKLQMKANTFTSWYNYPIGLKKDIQGNISEL